jgi:hypothetical protein
MQSGWPGSCRKHGYSRSTSIPRRKPFVEAPRSSMPLATESWSAVDARLIGSPGRVLLFVDCEGAELALLNPAGLPELRTCDIVIECHDFIDRSITATLTQRFSNSHKVENIIEGPRDPNRFKCLRHLGSADRWLAMDEGRPETMNWLVCWSQ